MTEFELIALLRETAITISQDFEFFVTATFAVIITGYVAGDRLKVMARTAIAVLYIGATAMFLLRYQNLLVQAQFLGDSLTSIGSDFPRTQYIVSVTLIRRVLVVFGAIAAVCSLFWPTLKKQSIETDAEVSAKNT